MSFKLTGMMAAVVQVVPAVDEVYTGMGIVLVLLHADRVRLLQGAPEQPLLARLRRPGGFPCRHLRPVPRRLP